MTEEEENKNKRTGVIVSVSIHAAVLLLFAFLMAWREPNPPLPEYGIELNFGVDDVGTGEVQPLTPVVDTENQEEAAPEEETTEVQEDEDVPAETPEETAEETPDQTETFEDLESPDIVEEQEDIEEVKEEVKEVPEVEEEKTETVVDPEEDKPEDITDREGAQGVEGEDKEAEAVNQGDKTNAVGDQGNEEGEVDERSLYGNPGGGGGASLKMAGWDWDSKPDPKESSDEKGRIVFEITIDDRGEIISIRTVEKTVSPSVEAIYRGEIEKLTFSKTDNLPPAPQSIGRITFIIRSN